MRLADVAVDKRGEPIELDKWIEKNGERLMYVRPSEVKICKTHKFDSEHECTRCPFVFTGFRSHLHLQKKDGIYNRQTGAKIA